MKVINSTLDIIKGLGDKVLKGVVYIGIGTFSILTSKITILMLVISLGMALVQVSTGFREEVKKKEKAWSCIPTRNLLALENQESMNGQGRKASIMPFKKD